MEGVLGSFMYIPILFVSQYVSCENKKICPDGKLDDIWILSDQVAENKLIVLFMVSLIFLIALF